jgi:hypothetical protein
MRGTTLRAAERRGNAPNKHSARALNTAFARLVYRRAAWGVASLNFELSVSV